MGLLIVNAKQIPPSDDEIRAIVEIEFHPEVRRWLIIEVGEDLQEVLKGYREFFENLPGNDDAEVLLAKYDGHIAGFLVLWRLDKYMEHSASVGLSTNPDYWGKGVATSLVNASISLAREKGFKRLEVETLAENTGMRRVAEKTGFKLECVRKDRIYKDKAYHDEVAYSLLI